ncbi:hypothetical protein AWB69_03085 [Caballeronia udeis]|uniref:Uncharacterized protein n=1 Tax=Caballeronia udeis TaxID=1232866 RepID=A0A158GPH1_9BURK|nr:hypothetical protein AWB69_03085 [Caballeronia udeis]
MRLSSRQSDLKGREALMRGLERQVNSSANAPALSNLARNSPEFNEICHGESFLVHDKTQL